MPNSFASLIMEQTSRVKTMQEVIGLLFEEGMKKKMTKMKKIMVLLEPSTGLLLNL
jgi:energy-coupling factor transporter transmembrane protein EcfT